MAINTIVVIAKNNTESTMATVAPCWESWSCSRRGMAWVRSLSRRPRPQSLFSLHKQPLEWSQIIWSVGQTHIWSGMGSVWHTSSTYPNGQNSSHLKNKTENPSPSISSQSIIRRIDERYPQNIVIGFPNSDADATTCRPLKVRGVWWNKRDVKLRKGEESVKWLEFYFLCRPFFL